MKSVRILLQTIVPLVLVLSLVIPAWVGQASSASAPVADDYSLGHLVADSADDSVTEGTTSGETETSYNHEPCMPCSGIEAQSEDDGVGVASTGGGEWTARPLKVNVQVDLKEEDDIVYVDDILRQIEAFDWRTTVFVTGELALTYPGVLADIQDKGHEIAVHGWQEGENLAVLRRREPGCLELRRAD